MNKNKGGGGPNKLSRKSRKLISKNKQIEIFQFNKQGEFIKEWKGIVETDAIFSTTNKSSSVWACVNGLQMTAYNFIWFKKEEFTEEKLKQRLEEIKLPQNGKSIIQMDLEENFIKKWRSIEDASKNLKINNGNIHSAIQRKIQKTAGGFKWKYND